MRITVDPLLIIQLIYAQAFDEAVRERRSFCFLHHYKRDDNKRISRWTDRSYAG